MRREVHRWVWVSLVAVLCAGTASCHEPLTQIVLVVHSELLVPDEIDRIDIAVVGPSERRMDRTADLSGPEAPRMPLTMGIRSTSGQLRPVEVQVTGRNGGVNVVERRVATGFVDGETRMLRIVLERDCVGAVCEDDELTCISGECVDPSIAPESLADWPGQPPHYDGGPPPMESPLPQTVEDLTSGAGHACMADVAGNVFCWGRNRAGQVGDGTVVSRIVPTWVPEIEGVVEVAGGDFHTCARRSSGEVLCWGRGAEGQLGNGRTANSSTPVPVEGITGAESVTAGNHHSCAVDSGSVLCWGDSSNGELGTMGSSPTPVVVPGISTATKVVAGQKHTCALLGDGTVRCWGANESGQLGNGTTMGSVTPVDVMLTDVTDLETGSLFTCSLTNVPALHCWGFNEYDQLGPTSDATIEPSPVEVPTSLDVLGFAAGDAHVCAVDSEFRVTCWGRNDRGQLGRGAAGDPQAMPQRLSSLSNIVTVSAGVRFTCAGRQTDMSAPVVHCWGDNAEGQLGNRTRGGFQAEPQQVMLAPP